MAEYKGKLLKGLIRAKNVILSNGVNVENEISDSVVSQKSGTSITISGFGVMIFYNAVTNCIINLPLVLKKIGNLFGNNICSWRK